MTPLAAHWFEMPDVRRKRFAAAVKIPLRQETTTLHEVSAKRPVAPP